MLKEKFAQRFKELDESFSKIQYINVYGVQSSSASDGWRTWATSSQSLIKAVFNESSPHYKNFVDSFEECKQSDGREKRVRSLHAIFLSAREDFEGDYVFNNIDLQISGEIFGDFVSLAKQSLKEGHKDVAAVLACAALEDALKRYAIANEIDVSGKTMGPVISLLKSHNLVSGLLKDLLETMPKIRNAAMHASWSEIGEPEVNSVIGFTEQFLLSKFSS